MNQSFPAGVEVSELPGGVCYRLPDRRPTAWARVSGLGTLLGGLALTAFGGLVVSSLLPPFRNQLLPPGGGGQGEWVQPTAALPLLLGLGLVTWGLLQLRRSLFQLVGCHRRIEVGGRLRVVDWLGPVRRTASRRLDRLHRLEIGPDPTAPRPTLPGAPPPPLALIADCTDAPLVLVSGRPRDWLERLAGHLRQRCTLAGTEAGAVLRREPAPVVLVPAPGDAAGPWQPPATARAAVSERDGVVTLTVGPPNLRYASLSSLFFGLPFVLIPIPLVLTILSRGGLAAWPALPWLGASFIIGLVSLVRGVRTVSTRAVLAVSGREVELTERDRFGVSHRRWPRAEVAGVGLGDSNLVAKRGGPAVQELRLRFADGSHRGLLAGRDERELAWMASVLDEALRRLPAAEDPRAGAATPPQGVPPRPPASRAVLEQTADGFRLTEPPLGWTGRLGLTALVGLLLLAAGATGGALLYQNWAALAQGPRGLGLSVAGALLAGAVALLGAAFLVEAVNFASRRRLVIVSGDTLRLRPTTWWGDRERAWRREEIVAIDVGPRPGPGDQTMTFPQLRVHTHVGKPQRFLAYHNEEEMQWVAALIRQALNVPASKG